MNQKILIKKAKFLIFDFDGTIANTTPLHEAAFKKIFKPFKISFNYCEIAGKSTKEAISYTLKKNKLKLKSDEIKNLITRKQSLVREQLKYSSNFEAMPYVKDFIKKSSEFYTLAIASSGSRTTIELALGKLELKNFFSYILCSEDVKEAKPSPEIFLKVLNLTNFNKEEALIFEDSYNGIKASNAAKIPVINITEYSFKKLLKEVKNINEIS